MSSLFPSEDHCGDCWSDTCCHEQGAVDQGASARDASLLNDLDAVAQLFTGDSDFGVRCGIGITVKS